MPERPPFKSDNRFATGIAVASIAALLLAVALGHFGVLSPRDTHGQRGGTAVQPAVLNGGAVSGAMPGASKSAPAPQTGKASWYDFDGAKTANGETMDADRLTAAHPTLPFGTKVKIENVENGRTVVVRVNDRGPYEGARIIDLSKEAAERLGMIDDGVAPVRVTPAAPQRATQQPASQ